MNAINKAEEVYNNSFAKQDEIDLATSSLSSSISTFKNNKVTRSDRDADGNYTREYVEAYVRNQMQDFLSLEGTSISVDDGIMDVYYNNELCYMVSSYSPTAGGFGRSEQWYIGSKTLREYSYIEASGW